MKGIMLITLTLLIGIALGWDQVSTSGTAPGPRGGGQMRVVGDELILFGGYFECFEGSQCNHTFYDELYHLDLDTNEWYKPTVQPDPVYGVPGKRAYFGATVDTGANALVIYGGGFFPVEFIDFPSWVVQTVDYEDLWYYYPDEYRWEYIETFGINKPGARSGAGIEIVGNKLILSSGINSATFISVEDTWELNLVTRSWTKLTGKFSDKVVNPFPFDLGRYIFPFVRKGSTIYAFSGNINPIPPLVGEQHQDLWSYKVSQNTWSDILPFASNDFTGRVHGGMSVIGNRIVVYFGDNNDNDDECAVASISSGQSPVDETWVYKLNPVSQRSWTKLQFTNPVPALKRIYYATSNERENIYVWGGFDAQCDENVEDYEIIWNTNLYRLDFDVVENC